MHNTHKPRVVQSSSIDVPTLLFTAKSANTAQTYPSVTLAAACPKPKKVHYKIKLPRSNATKSLQEIFAPPYGNHHQLPTVIDRHKNHTRPAFLAPAFVIDFLLSKDSSVHFLAQIRIATLWAITVCCYLQICAHVHAARFGDVWNSFPGLAWALLRCIWDIVRQDKNQTNIDAQQNSTTKTCALWSALT